MPDRGDLNEISRAIGSLESSLDDLKDQHRAAADSRKGLHEKLELLGKELIRISNSFTVLDGRVERMEPSVKDYEKLRQNINGGVLVISGIGAALFVTIGFFAKELFAWIASHIRVS